MSIKVGWRPTRRQLLFGGLAVVVVAGAVTAWALQPDPEPRQREYLDATACLLTDQQGISSSQAAPVWSAMSAAGTAHLVRVQYLAVNGEQTAGNASTYLTSLADGRCGVVIAVGAAQVAAVSDIARTSPAVRFATVGGGTAAANVQLLATGEQASDLVAALAG
ncbi:hypothetical protein [Actinoplanes palleronii]|uniref:BMP family ABC transporter substrate-binding protein n=1 Tax=Actinoplanes palleronii TaxID=113570 RepID=A0ABQ4B1D5_9ACTN|nr:hypothetical protein [Actinoplanes palleronii]GIE64377.1 hypothetical protein Apa02nite_004850 [Actinoplanes palleronii]